LLKGVVNDHTTRFHRNGDNNPDRLAIGVWLQPGSALYSVSPDRPASPFLYLAAFRWGNDQA